MRTRIAFTAIATTAAFCTAPSTAACNGHDLSFIERKTLDARLFFLEGMLRDPTPNLPQMCETITDLARTPYARAPMLSDGVCEKFTRSFTSVPSLADLPPADQCVMACNTLSSLDVGSNCTSVVDDVTAKEYFENVNADRGRGRHRRGRHYGHGSRGAGNDPVRRRQRPHRARASVPGIPHCQSFDRPLLFQLSALSLSLLQHRVKGLGLSL